MQTTEKTLWFGDARRLSDEEVSAILAPRPHEGEPMPGENTVFDPSVNEEVKRIMELKAEIAALALGNIPAFTDVEPHGGYDLSE